MFRLKGQGESILKDPSSGWTLLRGRRAGRDDSFRLPVRLKLERAAHILSYSAFLADHQREGVCLQ